MIDPQGQAVSWIRSKESSNLPAFGTAALNDPKLRDKLEFTMGDGKALIILGERGESYFLERMLTPVLHESPLMSRDTVALGRSSSQNVRKP